MTRGILKALQATLRSVVGDNDQVRRRDAQHIAQCPVNVIVPEAVAVGNDDHVGLTCCGGEVPKHLGIGELKSFDVLGGVGVH